jgi:hypothetical protein
MARLTTLLQVTSPRATASLTTQDTHTSLT